MNKERVMEVIRGIEYQAGRFLEMSLGAYVINNQKGLIVSDEGMKDLSNLMRSWAIIISEEFLGVVDE